VIYYFYGEPLMPLYDVRDTSTGEEKEVMCTYTALKEKVDAGEWVQVHKGSAALVTHVNGTLSKTSDGWKDLLKNMKKNTGRRGNTIKT